MKSEIKIYKIKSNPKNPRVIKNERFKKLVDSIETIPAFMELRPVIIDEDFMVLGGNMRLKAHQFLNRKEIWTDMFTKEMSDKMNMKAIEEDREPKTYLEYCEEIIIKDNATAGEWEYDMLANEWDSVLLDKWLVPVWQNPDDLDYANKNKEIDIDDLENTMKLSLEYIEDDFHFVKNKLSQIAATPGEAVKILISNIRKV